MTTQESICLLHNTYISLTGMPVRLDMSREQTWYWWHNRGLTVDDLRVVIRYLQGEIRQQRRNPGCLKFSNLIGHPDFFEEDLAMARAAVRARSTHHQGDRASVLEQTGRSAEKQSAGESKSVGQLAGAITRDPAAAAAAFAELQKLKSSL